MTGLERPEHLTADMLWAILANYTYYVGVAEGVLFSDDEFVVLAADQDGKLRGEIKLKIEAGNPDKTNWEKHLLADRLYDKITLDITAEVKA